MYPLLNKGTETDVINYRVNISHSSHVQKFLKITSEQTRMPSRKN